VNVDRFSITVDCRWEDLSPVTLSVLDFIRQRKLWELHFSLAEDIPASIIALSLTHASAVLTLFHYLTLQIYSNCLSGHREKTPAM
jgi:hypothetical protein